MWCLEGSPSRHRPEVDLRGVRIEEGDGGRTEGVRECPKRTFVDVLFSVRKKVRDEDP